MFYYEIVIHPNQVQIIYISINKLIDNLFLLHINPHSPMKSLNSGLIFAYWFPMRGISRICRLLGLCVPSAFVAEDAPRTCWGSCNRKMYIASITSTPVSIFLNPILQKNIFILIMWKRKEMSLNNYEGNKL